MYLEEAEMVKVATYISIDLAHIRISFTLGQNAGIIYPMTCVTYRMYLVLAKHIKIECFYQLSLIQIISPITRLTIFTVQLIEKTDSS